MERGRQRPIALLVVPMLLMAGCSTSLDEPRVSTAANPEAPTTSAGPSTTALVEGTAGAESASVVRIVDGDTFVAALGTGEEESVRLIGIDAPERDEPFATEATATLTSLIGGRDVELVRDVSDRDPFGRLLRYVYVDGLFVNAELVRTGVAVAKAYSPDTALQDLLDAAQVDAEGRSVGIWSAPPRDDSTTTSGSGAVAAGDVVISATRFDADGNDNENKNGEWVEVENLGAAPVDFTGWSLEDEGPNHVFEFPAGFMLDPGSRVRVFSGCGEPSPTELFFCNTGSAVWNNSGDTATLRDARGAVVATGRE